MFGLDEQTNSVIATIGTAIALLLALNLGVVLKSHFLLEPQILTKVITYFIVLGSGIIYVMYFTIQNLEEPTKEYVEGLVVGTGSASAIIIYTPAVLFTPIARHLTSGTMTAPNASAKLAVGMQYFIVFYLIGIGMTAIFSVLIVRGSELYARDASDEFAPLTEDTESTDETEENEGEMDELFEEIEDDDDESQSEVEENEKDDESSTATDTDNEIDEADEDDSK